MTKERIAKKLDKRYFSCERCGKTKLQERWVYKPYQYIPDHIPAMTENTCKTCVYKEEYGRKKYRKRMKEGSLDKT